MKQKNLVVFALCAAIMVGACGLAACEIDRGNESDNEEKTETFSYKDKTFEIVLNDMAVYVADEKKALLSEMDYSEYFSETFSVTFTFNSDGTGLCNFYESERYQDVISFSYSSAECSELVMNFCNYDWTTSIEFSGYQFNFTDCAYTKCISNGADVTLDKTADDTATIISMFAVGYNDVGVYIYMLMGGDSESFVGIYGRMGEITK